MPSRFWVSAALAGALLTAGAGCGDGGTDLGDDATLRVYVSLPLKGPGGGDGRDAADGARLALADAGGQAGGVDVEAVYLDDTEPGDGGAPRWSPIRAAANARTATQDSTSIAYLGDFESGATRASLPVTNQALMLQVSPASSAVDLVAPEVGSEEVPEVQSTGDRSFGRVIPADDAQAAAAVQWFGKLGVTEVGIRGDASRFSRSMADGFRLAASRAGLAIERPRPGHIYLAGTPRFPPGAMGSDAYLSPPGQDLPDYVTSAALDPSQLAPAGEEFIAGFRDEYGRVPGRYAAYGYEAMAVILDSIDRASDPADRTAVVDAFFETTDRESVLGTYSIDGLGDTSLDRMTGYEVRDGMPAPAAELRAGP